MKKIEVVSERIELPEFPFKRVLTLESLIDFWREGVKHKEQMHSRFAEPVIQKLKEAPELELSIKDFSVF